MVTPSRSGTEGNEITYSNYGSDQVIIDGQEKTREYCVNVSGKAHLAFKGLTLTGARTAAFLAYDGSEYLTLDGLTCRNSRFGIRLYGNVTPVRHITITNCTASGNSKYGIFLYKKVYDSTIGPNNHAFSNGGEDMSWGIEVGTDYPGSQADGARRIVIADNEVDHNDVQGIRTWNAVDVLVKNNYCHHNGATGIQIEDGSENVLVDGNRCEYNAQTYSYETGIWIDSSRNVAVRGNTIRGNTIGLSVTETNHAIVRNNVIFENGGTAQDLSSARALNVKAHSQDVVVVHNTMYRNGSSESTKGGVSIFEGSTVVFKNNIVSETRAPFDLSIDQDGPSDFNAVSNDRPVAVQWKDAVLTWATYLAVSGQDAHSLQGSPLFAAPDAADFRLKNGSPCLNAGDFLTRTTRAGSGKVVPVEDARYFTDGFGIGSGDAVVIRGQPVAAVTAVDTGAATLTLDRDLSWNKGDPVSYQYSGSGPSIGARGSMNDGRKPSTPASPHIIRNGP
jgi:parallel beta-helix repeat protein